MKNHDWSAQYESLICSHSYSNIIFQYFFSALKYLFDKVRFHVWKSETSDLNIYFSGAMLVFWQGICSDGLAAGNAGDLKKNKEQWNIRKYRKLHCRCCPMSLFIEGSMCFVGIGVLNCHKCYTFHKCQNSFSCRVAKMNSWKFPRTILPGQSACESRFVTPPENQCFVG